MSQDDFLGELTGRSIIEVERRCIYETISDQIENHGIDLRDFYDNPSYFGKNESGEVVPWRGRHPTLIHWPLAAYRGGAALCNGLLSYKQTIDSIVGNESIRWIQPEFWHSTVFSPVHSSNPDVISQSVTDILEPVRIEVSMTGTYSLNFVRILVTHAGALLAVAYTNNNELNSLRARLQRSIPLGSTSPLIHITLGHFVRPVASSISNRLIDYCRRFRDDSIIIGQIAVNFLTYGIYRAPFLEMTIQEIVRFPLRGQELS